MGGNPAERSPSHDVVSIAEVKPFDPNIGAGGREQATGRQGVGANRWINDRARVEARVCFDIADQPEHRRWGDQRLGVHTQSDFDGIAENDVIESRLDSGIISGNATDLGLQRPRADQ